MITTKEFNALKNDIDKWKWIIGNKDLGIVIMLDSDDTYGVFEKGMVENENEKATILQFDRYIGNSNGVKNLLKAIGIKFEEV